MTRLSGVGDQLGERAVEVAQQEQVAAARPAAHVGRHGVRTASNAPVAIRSF